MAENEHRGMMANQSAVKASSDITASKPYRVSNWNVERTPAAGSRVERTTTEGSALVSCLGPFVCIWLSSAMMKMSQISPVILHDHQSPR